MNVHDDEAAATNRLRRAALAFQTAQTAFLRAHRVTRDLQQEEADRLWRDKGAHIEGTMRASATELVAAFKAFSAAGLVAEAVDRRLVTEAQRHLKGGLGMSAPIEEQRARIRQRLDEVEELAHIEPRLAVMEGRLRAVELGLAELQGRLSAAPTPGQLVFAIVALVLVTAGAVLGALLLAAELAGRGAT